MLLFANSRPDPSIQINNDIFGRLYPHTGQGRKLWNIGIFLKLSSIKCFQNPNLNFSLSFLIFVRAIKISQKVDRTPNFVFDKC